MGCRLRSPAKELLRVTFDGVSELRIGRKYPGRGAWVCPQQSCMEFAAKRKAFDRALRTAVPSDAPPRLIALLWADPQPQLKESELAHGVEGADEQEIDSEMSSVEATGVIPSAAVL